MKLSAMLVVGCVSTWGLFTAFLMPEAATATFLGMLAPLVVGVGTVLLVEHTARTDLERLTASLAVAFFAKILFYGGYVGVVVGLLKVEPIPFVASFTAYFVVLQFTEALCFKTIFTGTGQRAATH